MEDDFDTFVAKKIEQFNLELAKILKNEQRIFPDIDSLVWHMVQEGARWRHNYKDG